LDPGDCLNPFRLVCMACGREPDLKNIGGKKMDDQKKCNTCQGIKSLTEDNFSKNRSAPDGWERFCKLCGRKKAKERRERRRQENSGVSTKRTVPRVKKAPLRRAINPDSPPLSGLGVSYEILAKDFKNVKYSSISKIDDTILLDQQILKAIKKSVANQIIRIIQEAFV